MTTRRAFIARTLAASAALSVRAGGASAQAWPSRPIRIVVPLPPGGGADSLVRVLAEPLRSALGQPILVENRVGADGRMGAEYVSKQPADGYTYLTAGTTNVAHPSLFRNMNYDILKDFTPVGLIIRVPFALLVALGVQATSPKEFVALARSRPGEITFGSSGIGSPFHLAGEMLKSMAGIDMLHVPYKGSGPVTTALLSGEVMSAFAPVGPFLQYIRSGKLRALGILNGYRTSILPDLPTLEESLSLPGFALDAWVGLLAPAGTRKAIVDRLNGEMVRIVRDPQFSKEHLLRQSYEPLGSTPEEMGETMKAALPVYARIVRDAKIVAE
jgi:tripartite-type tricarboxylate transporter receptor subunit TctC